MKYIQNLVSILFLFVLSAGVASAGYLEDVAAGSPQPTASAPAASAPEAAKPATVAIAKCAKNHGTAVVDDQQVPGPYEYMLAQNGFSSSLTSSIVTLTADKSTCFSLVGGRNAATARWEIKSSMQSIDASTPGAGAGNFVPAPIRGLGMLFGGKRPTTPLLPTDLNGVQVMVNITDLDTGKLVASVIGSAKKADVSAGAFVLANADGALAGEPSKNFAAQLITSAYVDAFRQLIPFMDKLNVAAPAK